MHQIVYSISKLVFEYNIDESYLKKPHKIIKYLFSVMKFRYKNSTFKKNGDIVRIDKNFVTSFTIYFELVICFPYQSYINMYGNYITKITTRTLKFEFDIGFRTKSHQFNPRSFTTN